MNITLKPGETLAISASQTASQKEDYREYMNVDGEKIYVANYCRRLISSTNRTWRPLSYEEATYNTSVEINLEEDVWLGQINIKECAIMFMVDLDRWGCTEFVPDDFVKDYLKSKNAWK